jgi:transglutaminase-like putative cysteine protease/streptogramin lyase
MKKTLLFLVLMLTFAASARVGDVLRTFPTPGAQPTGLAFDGKNLWLADAQTDRIYRIDPHNGKVLSSFESPGYHPEGLAWDGTHLWHVDGMERYLYRIDPSSGRAVKVLESNSPFPRGLAWDGHYLWMVDHKSDALLKLSPMDGMMVQTFPSPSAEPTGLAFDGTFLWIADRGADRIYLTDPAEGLCLSSLRATGPFPYGLAWDGGTLWCADYENRELYQIEVLSDDIFTRWDKKELNLSFVKEFRNYGPGTVTSLDIYLPIPESRDNQKLLKPVSFEPAAREIITDSWGQKLAHFRYDNLRSGSVVKPAWNVTAEVFAIEYFIYPGRVGSLSDIPAEIKAKYLGDGDKYQITDPYIQELAHKIAGGEQNPYWIARRVFEYLTESLSYNLKPVGGWNPAPTVLRRGTASCSEYSYTMIALCRALGVPVRYAGAVSLRGDDASYDDVFHRWTEVYLPPYGWIPFDANKGDAATQGGKVLGIGNIDSRYIITTENGGGDAYLWFGYNYGFTWSSEGKCRIAEESYGLWSPAGAKKYHKPL